MSARKEALLCAAVVGALLFLSSSADAGPFGIFGRNKANQTIQAPQGNACTYGEDGTCLTHGGSQPTNTNGPVTAEDLERAGGEFYTTRTAADEAAKDVPAKDAGGNSAEAGSVAEAEAALAAAEQNLLDKQKSLIVALLAQDQADAREALDQKQADDMERLELQQQRDDRTARLEALQSE